MPSCSKVVALLLAAFGLHGCTVVSVAGSAVGAAISITGSVVSTGVELTGKAVGAGIDAARGKPEDVKPGDTGPVEQADRIEKKAP